MRTASLTGFHSTPIRSYSMWDVLESDLTIVLHTTEQIVTLLSEASIQVQQRLTVAQTGVLLALLEAFPRPCDEASLYATLTGVEHAIAHEFLQVADDYRTIAMQPVRLVLTECRAILAPFNLGIQPGEGTTYRLFRLER